MVKAELSISLCATSKEKRQAQVRTSIEFKCLNPLLYSVHIPPLNVQGSYPIGSQGPSECSKVSHALQTRENLLQGSNGVLKVVFAALLIFSIKVGL